MPDAEKTILVVEDNEELREVLAGFLEVLGFPVLQAEDGLDALEVLRSQPGVGLVISDLMMPRMGGSGLRTAMLASETFRDIPFIVTSANPFLDRVAEEMQATAYIKKPFDLHDLDALIRLFGP